MNLSQLYQHTLQQRRKMNLIKNYTIDPLNTFYKNAYPIAEQYYDLLKTNVFLIPREIYGIFGIILIVMCFSIFWKRRWVYSKPNQWLLVIRNGKLVKSGVGISTWRWLTDTIVIFPSKVEKVSFSANNITKEMQGIIIKGFVFWSVDRNGQGPFKCYKYMRGFNTNNSVRAICESALRNRIANSTINQVMKNRNHIRQNMHKDLNKQFKGWGIWLESVEITQVKISSKKLFEDLQAEYRQETKMSAILTQLSGIQKMTEQTAKSEIKMFELNEKGETKNIEKNFDEKLKRITQQEAYLKKNINLEIEKLVRSREIQLKKIFHDKNNQIEKIKKDQIIEENQLRHKLQTTKKQIQMDKMHNVKTLKKYSLDTTSRIYQNMQVKELKINRFGDSSLMEILPNMSRNE